MYCLHHAVYHLFKMKKSIISHSLSWLVKNTYGYLQNTFFSHKKQHKISTEGIFKTMKKFQFNSLMHYNTTVFQFCIIWIWRLVQVTQLSNSNDTNLFHYTYKEQCLMSNRIQINCFVRIQFTGFHSSRSSRSSLLRWNKAIQHSAVQNTSEK